MIRYDLVCESGHIFDGWFRDSATYDEQAAAGEVACPNCGTTAIEKQIMAPAIPVKSNRKADKPQRMLGGSADPKTAALLEAVKKLREHVAANAEYVGDKFAEEARRIHYEETEARGIYGEATLGEAESLLEEGIAVHPLPKLPDESN
jgi:hypothetical protein